MTPADFPELYEYAGLFGVVLYLSAYGLLQAGLIGGNSYTYTLLNLFAAAFVLVSLALHFNLSSALIQISWIAISIFGMIRVFILNRRIRFSEEEQFLRDAKLPALSGIDARKFLDRGAWLILPKGEVLTQEGMPVTRLLFLAEGEARVTLEGETLASITPGGFVGEIAALTGAAASATVTAHSELRVFVIQSESLNRLCQSNDQLRISLFQSIGAELGQKLKNSNKIIRNQVG